MAILQLSRISNRKGLAEDLPQLAGAEFGWALDERKLYIGNGELIDGAPTIGNTELLTEHSDILALPSTYTYKGSEAGYVVETGPGSTDIVRSLQAKFDDFASVKDFGATGDGITDDTAAINRALYELFCKGSDERTRRSLYFPAGVYRVSDSIKIPPHAKLWGEGLTSSIINFVASDPILTPAMTSGVRYAITRVDVTTAADWQAAGAGNIAPAFPAVDTIFVATGPVPGTGTVRVVAAQVVETADSLQQTGIDIGVGVGAEAPTGIEVNAMGIHSTEDNTLLKLDSVTNSGFSYLGLRGPNTDTTIEIGTASIEIATSAPSPNTTTHDITISKLVTSGTTYGLKAAGNAKGVVLENSGLDSHFKGVFVTNPTISAQLLTVGVKYKIVEVNDTDFTALGADYNREGVTFTATGDDSLGPGPVYGQVVSMDDMGPTGVVVSRNIFDNIAREGVHFENTLFNSSGYNVFYDVANAAPGIPVITLGTDRCVSVGDLFERQDESNAPRVSLEGNGGIYLDGAHSIHLGSYERQVGIAADLLLADTGSEIFKIIEADPNSYQIDYHIKTATATKRGTITVSSYNGTVTFNDEFTESGTTGIMLDAVFSGLDSNSELQFTAVNDAVINFSVVLLD